MTKAFKKGDLVTYIDDWDRKGSTYYRHAVVYSCGKKQMVLTDAETGVEMGRNFRPERASGLGDQGTFPRLTEEEARAHGIALAEVIIEREIERYGHCLTIGAGDAYDSSIRKDIAQIHEPDTASYADRIEAIRAVIRNRYPRERNHP